MVINENTSVNELLDESKRLLLNVPSGTVFLVRDLFRGYEWNAIPVRNRIRLGNLFVIYAEGEGAALVEICAEKSRQNQQKYIRK